MKKYFIVTHIETWLCCLINLSKKAHFVWLLSSSSSSLLFFVVNSSVVTAAMWLALVLLVFFPFVAISVGNAYDFAPFISKLNSSQLIDTNNFFFPSLSNVFSLFFFGQFTSLLYKYVCVPVHVSRICRHSNIFIFVFYGFFSCSILKHAQCGVAWALNNTVNEFLTNNIFLLLVHLWFSFYFIKFTLNLERGRKKHAEQIRFVLKNWNIWKVRRMQKKKKRENKQREPIFHLIAGRVSAGWRERNNHNFLPLFVL